VAAVEPPGAGIHHRVRDQPLIWRVRTWGIPTADQQQHRQSATDPTAVVRLEILAGDRPEHQLRLAQQLDALRALLLHTSETDR
jgi:hypothetical protein